MAEEPVTTSIGNVFEDLGLPNPQDRLLKAGLVLQIHRVIRDRGLTQSGVATLTGVSQPKISDLLRGRSQGFSTDRLLKILNRLGQDVAIIVRPNNESRPALVSVTSEA